MYGTAVRGFVMMVALLATLLAWAAEGETVRVGIAWQPYEGNYDRVVRSIRAAGGEPVILEQLRPAGIDYDGNEVAEHCLDENGILLQNYADAVKRHTWHSTMADSLLAGVQAVVFLGGGDVCPTLFATPEPWHGIDAERNYDVARDLSEYLTMAYCLDHDIPVLGLCRGMQLLGVVSGAPLIQDLPTYYEQCGTHDRYVHRSARDSKGERHYTPHDVVVTDHESLLWAIAQCDTIHGAPSWHHQAVGSINGTPLRVTAITTDDGISVIEAIERTDKTFALGVQYHPEEAVRRHLDHAANAHRFMPLDEGLAYFQALIHHARQAKAESEP